MILDRKYIGSDVYASLDFKIYQLVFEHNFTTENCFKNDEEAKNINIPNKFSILYDLNSTKYLFKDNFRYYIIEYPELKIFNAWKQTISPTEEIERSGLSTATGFTQLITEAPQDGWGGLVKTTYPDHGTGTSGSYLDGIPRDSNWWFCIGLLCKSPSKFLNHGIPGSSSVIKRVSLWSAIRDSQIYFKFEKYSCICPIYHSLAFDFTTIIFICS